MNIAIEALERQLHAIRSLREAIETVNRQPQELRRRVPSNTWSQIREYANEVALLGAARPMFWTAETTAAVASVAPTFALQTITAEREILYCDIAFCWFAKPILSVSLFGGGTAPVHALTWAFSVAAGEETPMIRLAAFTVKRNGAPEPVTWTHVLNGATLDSFPEPESADLMPDRLSVWRKQCTELFQFVVCAGAFLRQRIAVAETERADRHARKRIVAAGWTHDPIVSVVQLREREHRVRDDTDSGHREYHWRWMVRAHTRQQFYPSIGKHLPVLVGPYLKGPDDKPLKPRTAPIFMVNR